MSRINTFKTIAATLTAAVGIGFVVQYGEQQYAQADATTSEAARAAPRTLMMAINAQGDPVFGVPDVVTTPLNHAANVQPVVAVDAVYMELNVPQMGEILATPVAGCDMELSAKRTPAAIVTLTIDAPCFSGDDLVIQHEDLVFATVADREGQATVDVPALVTDATFTVSVQNIVQAGTSIFVPELRQYDRAVLQWSSADNMRLHALEGGAQIGDPGHVWSASIHSAQDTRDGRHGFVVYLGAKEAGIPYQAEVYTFPAGQMNRDGGVDLQIGVTVNDDNCGREVDATTIQTNAGQMLVKTDIAAQMPPCDQAGSVAFVADKFTDLTLASR